MLREIQESHISANVPPAAVFEEYLVRDLKAYFKQRTTNDFKIEYELLRKEPTQSGIAYPKFYVWVRCSNTNSFLVEGIVRLAAVDKKRFEVATFIEKRDIIADPTRLGAFPQALLSKIRAKAGLKD